MKQSKQIVSILTSVEFIKNDMDEALRKLNRLYASADRVRQSMPITDYKPEIAQQKIDGLSASVRDSAATCREIGLLKVTADFEGLRESIRTWMMQAPPEDFVRTIQTYKDFGLTPSREEVESLNLSAGDNYIAQRILTQLAGKSGFESGYPDAQDIAKMVTKAETECRHVIADYVGAFDNNYHLAGGNYEYIDLRNGGWTRNCYAADYLTRDDTTLCDIDRTFRRCDIALMPSIIDKLDSAFDGCETQDSRVDVAAKLIQTDNRYDGWVAAYDSEVHAAAILRLAQSAETQAARLAEQYKDAEDALRQQIETASNYQGMASQADKARQTA